MLLKIVCVMDSKDTLVFWNGPAGLTAYRTTQRCVIVQRYEGAGQNTWKHLPLSSFSKHYCLGAPPKWQVPSPCSWVSLFATDTDTLGVWYLSSRVTPAALMCWVQWCCEEQPLALVSAVNVIACSSLNDAHLPAGAQPGRYRCLWWCWLRIRCQSLTLYWFCLFLLSKINV